MTDPKCSELFEWDEPDETQVAQALELLGRPERRRDFFDQLDNPRWLRHLAARGVFDEAPAPVKTDEQWVQFPPWFEGNFLLRMAPLVPTEVADLLLRVDDRDNAIARRQIVAAALELPVAQSERLIGRICEFVTSDQYELLDPQVLVRLVEHLAQAPSTRAMSLLVQAMYGPRPPAPESAGRPLGFRSVATGLKDYWYQQTLSRAYAALESRFRLNATRDLTRWLAEWQRLEGYTDPEGDDLSYLWRPSISGAGEGPGIHPVGDALVEVLRDALGDAIATKAASLEQVHEILDRPEQQIFRRIEFYLIAKALREGADLDELRERAVELVLNGGSLDVAVRHEFSELARAALAIGEKSVAESLTEQIRAFEGIDDATLRARVAGERPLDEVAAEELEAVRERARYGIVAAIGEPLPEPLATYARSLDAKFGPRPAEPADTPYRLHSGAVGPVSPLTIDALRAMSLHDILDFARTWQPPEANVFPPPPSPEGLGRQLAQLVREDPDRFSTADLTIAGLGPTYVRAILEGFEQAARNAVPIHWERVLALLAEVARKEDRGESPVRAVMHHDTGWRWCHSQAASLIGVALAAANPIAADHIPVLWEAIKALTESPDPAPDAEAGWMGPMDMSLNVVRGKAMRAAMDLVARLRRESGGRLDEESPLVRDIETMLDRHLDPVIDPSPAVRSVYGEHFYLLLGALPRWVAENLSRIFGDPASKDPLGDVAWSSYIARHEPTQELVDLLHDQYVKRTAELSTTAEPDRATRDMERGAARMAEHVLLLCAQGTIPLDEEGGLARTLLDSGQPALLSQALGHLGWRLFRTEGDLSDELLGRFVRLWDDRAAAVEEGRADPLVLREYGWWVRSHRFPVDWALERLRQVALAPNPIDMLELIGRELVPYARSHTELTLEIFGGLLAQREDGFMAARLLRHAAPAIAVAQDSPDTGLQQRARDLLNAFVQAGQLDVRGVVERYKDASPDDYLE